jgi:hypothetical protein
LCFNVDVKLSSLDKDFNFKLNFQTSTFWRWFLERWFS